MTDREKQQDAWTTYVANAGRQAGQVGGVLVYLGDEPGDVRAETFLLDAFSRETSDAILASIADVVDRARKQLAAGNN